MTALELSRSIRWPKLLQPSPTSETRRPDLPRLRKYHVRSLCNSARDARMRAAGRQSARPCAAPRASHAALALAERSATGIAPAGSVPDNKKKSASPTRGKRNAPSAPRGRAVDRSEDRLEPDRPRAQPRHHRGGRVGALPHPARHRRRRGDGGAEGDRPARHRVRRAVRRGRLFHADLLRPVRAAHDRRAITFPIASRRSPASPAIRSATMSAPACSPAARCAIASIRPGG